MATFENGAGAMIGVIFIVLSASILVPALILNLENPQTTSFEQEENTRFSITGSVSSRATDIKPSQDTANVTLLNGRSGDFAATGTMSQGETRSVAIDGETINVTLVNVISDTEAVFTYEYPLYISWPDGAQIFVNNLTEIILLAMVVFLTSSLLTLIRVYSNV